MGRRLWIWCALIASSLAGCALDAEATPDDGVISDVDDNAAKADGAEVPLGTFELDRSGRDQSLFTRLVLRKTAEGELRFYANPIEGGVHAGVVPPVEGPFKFTRYRDKRYVRLLDEEGSLFARYEYQTQVDATTGLYSRDYLGLKDPSHGRFVPFLRAEHGFCREADECGGQGLSFPRCLGRVTCEEQRCGYDCSAPTEVSVTLSETATDASWLADILEGDLGTGEENNTAVVLLHDYVPSTQDPRADLLTPVLREVIASVDPQHAAGTFEIYGEVQKRTFDRHVDNWSLWTLYDTVFEEQFWDMSADEPVVFGKFSGRGTTALFSGGAPQPATYVAYVAVFTRSRHVLTVLDVQGH